MKKILIIEDDTDIAANVEYALSKEGFDVIVSHDGQDGFEKYKSERPDLIVLDIGLPKLNGNALCRQIRRDCDDQKTIILMLTGRGDDADRIIGRVIGADRYITKPFDMAELLNIIKGLLNKGVNSLNI